MIALSLGSRVNKAFVFSASVIGLLLSSCSSDGHDSEHFTKENSFTIGLLLPFTGSSAGTARNFERAALLAAEGVNENGGIHGKNLRIIARDTHSDIERSQEAVSELLEEGAMAIVGPESADIASKIIGTLNDEGVAFLSPVIGEGEEVEIDCDYPWFRLSPSAESLGGSLANTIFAQDIESIAIVYGDGNYNRAFRAALRDKFSGVVIGGDVLIEVAVDEGDSSYSEQLREVLDAEPEAIVLATSPETGAIIVTEYGLLAKEAATWAFSPLLKTPLFLQNVASDQVEGAFGVAPKIFENSDDFQDEYSAHWQGDFPLDGAYFYYDTIGLLSVALGLTKEDSEITYENFTASIVQAASNNGESFSWDELPKAIDRAEEGSSVNYSGLTGPLLLQDCGERRTGRTDPWRIEDAKIVEGRL